MFLIFILELSNFFDLNVKFKFNSSTGMFYRPEFLNGYIYSFH